MKPTSENVAWLVNELQGRGWVTAADLLKLCNRPPKEGNRRWIRALADASKGRIAGGQQGYKLVEEMTREEYSHWRNWMSHQADEMKRRVVEADRVFYGRKSVRPGHGILEPAATIEEANKS